VVEPLAVGLTDGEVTDSWADQALMVRSPGAGASAARGAALRRLCNRGEGTSLPAQPRDEGACPGKLLFIKGRVWRMATIAHRLECCIDLAERGLRMAPSRSGGPGVLR
jgi:hypothetical protein